MEDGNAGSSGLGFANRFFILSFLISVFIKFYNKKLSISQGKLLKKNIELIALIFGHYASVKEFHMEDKRKKNKVLFQHQKDIYKVQKLSVCNLI